MRSRFWIALVAGGLVGGTAVGSFGPFVRARVAERAAGLGAEAQVRQVVPTWDGVELRDVSLAFPGIPGVRVWVGRLLIGWQDHRPRVIAGGRVVAFGTLATLARDVESWRVEHRPRDGDVAASEGGAGLAASGFEVHWRSGPENNADSVDATGVSLMRQDEKFVIGSRSFDASRGRFKVSAEDARMVLGKDDGRWRVSELSTRTLAFAETAHGGEDESHPLGGGDCAKSLLRDSPVEPPHPRVARTRCLHRELVRLAGRIDALVTSNVNVRAHGTRAKLTIAGEPLELRPGTLSLARETGTLVVSLEPEPGLASDATELSGQSTAKSAALKLSVRIPLPGASAPAPIVAELKGGPVRISMLGVRDGDVGLRHVDSAYLESDARLEVPADGSAVVMHGTGRVRDLSVHHPRLAAAPLEGIDLAWHGDVTMALDGSRIEIKKTEVDLGSLRLVLDGRVLRKGDDLDVDLRFDLPIVTCQKVLESVPRALVSDLSGIAFSGSLAAKGRFRFDTARIATIYDVGWDGALGCRVTAAPDSLKPGRFKSIFRKTVYTPGGEPKEMEFGPGTNDWVPYGALGPFMETAVLASEDGRFPRHHGFDQEAIVNSIRENLAAHRFKRGASTISMQLAKNL
ncbi:MAG: hypothetical protein EXR75_10180 [Myxococcales bacterium]|nr:hypothetical protein [Myxococcales bacterium]